MPLVVLYLLAVVLAVVSVMIAFDPVGGPLLLLAGNAALLILLGMSAVVIDIASRRRPTERASAGRLVGSAVAAWAVSFVLSLPLQSVVLALDGTEWRPALMLVPLSPAYALWLSTLPLLGAFALAVVVKMVWHGNQRRGRQHETPGSI